MVTIGGKGQQLLLQGYCLCVKFMLQLMITLTVNVFRYLS